MCASGPSGPLVLKKVDVENLRYFAQYYYKLCVITTVQVNIHLFKKLIEHAYASMRLREANY